MLKEALEYIVGMRKPFFWEDISGYTYSDKPLIRVPEALYAESIKTNTLTGLCGYIKSGADKMDARMILHVVSPTKVRLLSALNGERGAGMPDGSECPASGIRFRAVSGP